MIKTILYLAKLLLALITTLSLQSCVYKVDLDSITGSGNIVSETRNHTNFDKITIKSGLSCEIIQSHEFKVIVKADDNVVQNIKTSVQNNTLIIETEDISLINFTSKIIVQLPSLKAINSSSGAYAEIPNVFIGEELSITASSGSEIKANVEFDTIYLDSSSGSSIDAKGKALKLYTDSSSGSTIDAGELYSNYVTSKASSGSSSEINPIINLDARASSGSSIEYKTIPKTINIDESSGGSVSH
jgi:hypothetical protein